MNFRQTHRMVNIFQEWKSSIKNLSRNRVRFLLHLNSTILGTQTPLLCDILIELILLVLFDQNGPIKVKIIVSCFF